MVLHVLQVRKSDPTTEGLLYRETWAVLMRILAMSTDTSRMIEYFPPAASIGDSSRSDVYSRGGIHPRRGLES